MELDIKRYTHVPLYVMAVQVTAENMEAVAKWCDGSVTEHNGTKCIRVATIRPITDRQTMAMINDWVLKTDVGLKVYRPKAFSNGFVEAPEVVVDNRDEVMKTVLHDPAFVDY